MRSQSQDTMGWGGGDGHKAVTLRVGYCHSGLTDSLLHLRAIFMVGPLTLVPHGS